MCCYIDCLKHCKHIHGNLVRSFIVLKNDLLHDMKKSTLGRSFIYIYLEKWLFWHVQAYNPLLFERRHVAIVWTLHKSKTQNKFICLFRTLWLYFTTLEYNDYNNNLSTLSSIILKKKWIEKDMKIKEQHRNKNCSWLFKMVWT